jgi:hypothetical protein
MPDHDDRNGEEADVAYEAVAQLVNPQSGDQYAGAALSELHVLGQD